MCSEQTTVDVTFGPGVKHAITCAAQDSAYISTDSMLYINTKIELYCSHVHIAHLLGRGPNQVWGTACYTCIRQS